MNVFTGTARIGRDAEVRHTQAGSAVASFSIAIDSGYGENKTTSWLNASLWGKRAEGGLVQYLIKGQQIAVSGEIKVREYDDKDGNKRTSVDLNINELDLIGGNPAASSQQSSHGQQQNNGNFPSHGGSQKQPAQQVSDPFSDDTGTSDEIPF